MIYLDNAATSYPKPERVIKRVEYVLREAGGNPGRSAHRLSLLASRTVFSARESLARLLKIRDSSRIAFTKNATEGINTVLKGLLRRGDHVITTAFEHNAVARTLRRLEQEGIWVTKIRGSKRIDRIEPQDIEPAITPRTRLVCIVHASNVIGTIQPVAEIGEFLKKRDIPLMVDGAQTVGLVGVYPEEMNIDILVGTGHKALYGPQGTGFVYIREGLEVDPLIDGGAVEGDQLFEMPERLETGTLNTPGIGGLGEGVEFVLQEGLARIRHHEKELVGYLLQELDRIRGVTVLGPLSPEERVSLVSFTIDGVAPEEMGKLLDERFSIMVRCGTHCAPDAHRTAGTYPYGAIRVSPGYFNRMQDVEEFVRAVVAIRRELEG